MNIRRRDKRQVHRNMMLESRMPGNRHVRFGGERSEKCQQWQLVGPLPYYNAGLQERRDAYEIAVKRHPNYYNEEARKQRTREHGISYYEQKRELVDIKEERPEYAGIASHVLQDVILRLKRS